MGKKNRKVFFDITICSKAAGRIVFELYYDLTPLTSQNFRGICTSDYGNCRSHSSKKKLHYLGSKIHRIVKGFCVQGGDITNNDGTGGQSIYGHQFADQNFSRKHSHAGILSMANKGPNTNSSQFFITLKPCPHLDGKHVVFGQVIAGMDIIQKIGQTPTDFQNRPRISVEIFDCGELDDIRAHLRQGNMKSQFMSSKDQEKQEQALPAFFGNKVNQKKKIDPVDLPVKSALPQYQSDSQSDDDDEEDEKQQQQKQDSNNKKDLTFDSINPSSKFADRIYQLKLKMNQARMLNSQAVIEQKVRQQDPNYYKKLKHKQWCQKNKKNEDNLAQNGVPKQKKYFNQTLSSLQKKAQFAKKGQNKRNFTKYLKNVKDNQYYQDINCGSNAKESQYGWDVFNDDAIYRSHNKRMNKLDLDINHYNNIKKQGSEKVSKNEEEKKTQEMANQLTSRMENRKDFSRRRAFMEDQEVNYINERNRVFNKKVQRNFQKYTKEIRANLERGTAM